MAKKKAEQPNDNDALLTTWKGMLTHCRAASENEVWELLKYELKHKRRPSFAMRLHGIANDKRYARERKEIMANLSK